VVARVAEVVKERMQANIRERFYDTGETMRTTEVDPPRRPLERDIGPQTDYALFGELGWHQTHAWGRKLDHVIYHAGLHFARDALYSVTSLFLSEIRAAMQKLAR
jgi:hypothetical protein